MRLLWPAYFASREHDAVPGDERRCEAYSGLWDVPDAPALPRLEAALPGVAVPFGFLAGAASPMPADQATAATARAIPGAWVDVVDGAGHFPWRERPGCVRAALEPAGATPRRLDATFAWCRPARGPAQRFA